MPSSAVDRIASEPIERLSRRLGDALKRHQAATASRLDRHRLRPRLAYGRHRGPARLDSRRAAVVISVYPQRDSGRLCLTLTRRPLTLSHHRGQICLPGGRIEPGESPIQAALREYREELGVAPRMISDIGRLTPMYVYASDNWVETVLITAERPSQEWTPDPVEVDEVIEMPLECLLQLGDQARQGAARHESSSSRDRQSGRPRRGEILAKKMRRGGKARDRGGVFHFEFGYQAMRFIDCRGAQRELWGATAMLLEEFANILHLLPKHPENRA